MACEKCWSDAYLRMLSEPSKTRAEHYSELLDERRDRPCTPEQERRERPEVEIGQPGHQSKRERETGQSRGWRVCRLVWRLAWYSAPRVT